jgi:hypothetical protein
LREIDFAPSILVGSDIFGPCNIFSNFSFNEYRFYFIPKIPGLFFIIKPYSFQYDWKNHFFQKSKYGYLTPKVLQRSNFGFCCFGHVAMIRRCDMIFWEFYGK